MLGRDKAFRVYDFHYAAIQLSTFQHFSSPMLILPHISEKAQLSLDFFDSLKAASQEAALYFYSQNSSSRVLFRVLQMAIQSLMVGL